MKNFLLGAGLIFSLEMRQRLRGVAWYVLLGVFFLILAIVTVIVSVIVFGFASSSDQSATEQAAVGGPVYSGIIYFVLLLGTLVAPAMSGNAINGDRDAGTLATTQVTLVTTGQIVLGKFLAAWVTALGFLLVSSPFLIFGAVLGKLSGVTLLVSILVLALELGVIAAIGVGLSGLISRPLFSVVVTYLAVAALSLGTLIVFTLGGLIVQTHSNYYYFDTVSRTSGTCTGLHSYNTPNPRFDHVWGALAANPYVLLADAIPTTYNNRGEPTDLFGILKAGERQAQLPPSELTAQQTCKQDLTNPEDFGGGKTSKQVIDSTAPGWAVGLAIQFVLAGLALWGAWRKTRTPAGRLISGSRVA